MPENKLVIYGNGYAAHVAWYYLRMEEKYEIVGFTVDEHCIEEESMLGLPLVPFGEVERHFAPGENKMMVCIAAGNANRLRAEKFAQAREKGYHLISYVHPSAVIIGETRIGENCFIGAGAVIHPSVVIGDDVVVRDNCFIGHHTEIGDHCFLSPGASLSGRCRIGAYVTLGTNSTVKDGITIARYTIAGAGVTVLQDTEEGDVYMSKQGQKLPFSSLEMQNMKGNE